MVVTSSAVTVRHPHRELTQPSAHPCALLLASSHPPRCAISSSHLGRRRRRRLVDMLVKPTRLHSDAFIYVLWLRRRQQQQH